MYWDSTYICACGSFAPVSIILPLDMAALFWGCGNTSYSCYQSNDEWLKTYWKRIILFQYARLKYNYIENQSFNYWYIFFIWQLFLCKIIDTGAKLPQAHMYVESQYILIVLEMCAHGKSYLKHICTWNLNRFWLCY
jgi:hypothetical protein